MLKYIVSVVFLTSLAFSFDSKIQNQIKSLDELSNEIDSADVSKFDQYLQNEIQKYQGDIQNLKHKLSAIKLEEEKNSDDKEEMKKLVEEYNAKLKELEKDYISLTSKLKSNKSKDDFLSKRDHESIASDSLNCEKRRRRIKDQFAPLEIIEINSGDNTKRYTIRESGE